MYNNSGSSSVRTERKAYFLLFKNKRKDRHNSGKPSNEEGLEVFKSCIHQTAYPTLQL